MANDLLHALIRANLAGTAVALILLAARAPLRKIIGPTAVYALWGAVLAAGLASLLPPRTVVTILHAAALGGSADGAVAAANAGPAGGPDWSRPLMRGWAAGAVVVAVSVIWRHYRFFATVGRLEAGDGVLKAVTSNAGPAVIGLIAPRILLPGDFETRFSPRERSVILAHEGIHLARGDSRINAAVLAVQCLCWFNPLAHIAARALRLDQELACDAGVMARFPTARRSYAEAMLKSQTDPITLPAGCYWQAKGASALSHRLTLLKAEPLSRGQVGAGLAIALLLTSGAGLAAWAVQPVRRVIVVQPEDERPVAVVSVAAPTAQRSAVTAPASRLASVRPHIEAMVEPAPPALAVRQPSPVSSLFWGSMPMPAENPETSAVIAATAPVLPDGRMIHQVVNSSGQIQTSSYRNGAYQMKSDFVSVGDKVQVSTQLYKNGDVIGAGTATVTAGETAYVALSNGQMATVTPGKTAYLITPSPHYMPSPATAAPS